MVRRAHHAHTMYAPYYYYYYYHYHYYYYYYYYYRATCASARE